jgi:hypothetical protein
MRNRGVPGRRALPTNHLGLSAFDVMDHDRHVAAGSVEMRLDDLQRESCGHAGIDGVSASLENSHADRGRNPMRAGGHTNVPSISGRVVNRFGLTKLICLGQFN